MLSIIVPTLNEEEMLELTMRYLTSQDYKEPYEIIVADGMSHDMTVEIAGKYADKVVMVEKSGIAAGRNAGARAASGEILLFVDADTLVLPDVAGRISEAFEHDEDVIAVAPNVFPTDSSLRNVMTYWLFNRLSKLSTRVGNPLLGGMCVAYRKDAFDRVGGFDERLKSGEDIDMSFRLRKLGKFRMLDGAYAYTSARRLDEWGRLRFIYRYVKGYLLGKAFGKGDYERVG